MLFLQIPAFPAPPANATFEWWLIGITVLGVGALFKWLTAVVGLKDQALKEANSKAVEVLVEHTAETRNLTAAIDRLANGVQESIRMQTKHIETSQDVLTETRRLADIKDRQISLLEEQNQMLRKQLQTLP